VVIKIKDNNLELYTDKHLHRAKHRMNRIFHIALGIVIVAVHSYVLANLTEIIPAFGPHPHVPSTGREAGGQAVFELLPFIAAGLFLFADPLTNHLSPRSQFTGEPLLGRSLWYILGYGVLVVCIALYALFTSV
jgi:hypothetical protein